MAVSRLSGEGAVATATGEEVVGLMGLVAVVMAREAAAMPEARVAARVATNAQTHRIARAPYRLKQCCTLEEPRGDHTSLKEHTSSRR